MDKNKIIEDLAKQVENIGLLPIRSVSKQVLVVDINYLTAEQRELDHEFLKENLEEEYGVKVILIDGSRQNIQGSPIHKLPIYFA